MESAEAFQYCQVATLKQSRLLCSQHSRARQRIPLLDLLVLLLSTNQTFATSNFHLWNVIKGMQDERVTSCQLPTLLFFTT